MKSYLWLYGLAIIGAALVGVMMAEQFSIMLYAMVIVGSIMLGLLAART